MIGPVIVPVIVLGLTGSVGMGKSTTAAMLVRAGLPVFDADAAVHALQAPDGAAIPLLRAAFPGVVDDNNILDRKALAARIFADTADKARLEAIMHPLVAEARAGFLSEAQASGAWAAVLDVPLLFETGLDKACDYTLVVSAPYSVQRARVLARDGMSEALFEKITASQMPDSDKRARADFVLNSDQPLPDMEAELAGILARLKAQNPER